MLQTYSESVVCVVLFSVPSCHSFFLMYVTSVGMVFNNKFLPVVEVSGFQMYESEKFIYYNI